MRRKILPGMALAVVLLGPVGWAQHTKAGPVGKNLIAWTHDQKADPIPATQAPNSPAAQQDDAQSQPAAQAFSGMIMKSGDTYVLQTIDNITYQLDDQERAKAYEGKQVQVTGSLDKTTNTIKVHDIKQAA